MNELVEKYFHDQNGFQNLFYSPATDERIEQVEKKLGIEFPADYKAFLKLTNGFGGFVGESHIIFNPVEEIIEQTEGYCEEFFPWAVHIASDGGGSMYVLDKRPERLTYGIIPCIADDDDLIHLGASFDEFVKHLYHANYYKN
jgi:cell wall assembly regulator SMI1